MHINLCLNKIIAFILKTLTYNVFTLFMFILHNENHVKARQYGGHKVYILWEKKHSINIYIETFRATAFLRVKMKKIYIYIEHYFNIIGYYLILFPHLHQRLVIYTLWSLASPLLLWFRPSDQTQNLQQQVLSILNSMLL